MNPANRRSRAILLTVVAIVLVGFLLFWIFQRRRPAPPPPAPVPPVVLDRPTIIDMSREMAVPGILEAESVVTVLPRVSGLLREVLVEEGDTVTAGAVIARIDPAPYDLELASAESAFLLAESAFLRIERLHASSGASLQQLD